MHGADCSASAHQSSKGKCPPLLPLFLLSLDDDFMANQDFLDVIRGFPLNIQEVSAGEGRGVSAQKSTEGSWEAGVQPRCVRLMAIATRAPTQSPVLRRWPSMMQQLLG